MVLAFLDVVPNEVVLDPRGLLVGNLYALTRRIMMDGKPLAALVADNGFHQDAIGTIRRHADACNQPVQIHQRGSRR